MATIRHALFAEAGVRLLQETEQVAFMPVADGLPMKQQADVLRAKLPAPGDATRLSAVLFPEDD
jgi:hypothetical protein